MKWILTCIFLFRLWLSLITYNADIINHQAWMYSVESAGWQGLYARDMGERAPVNYPPLVLYSFWLGEKIYDALPDVWQTEPVHASMYKFPSILADVLVSWLIWRYTAFAKRTKLLMMGIYLFNPALIYNSVWWGQVESLVTFFCIWSLILFARGRSSGGVIAFALAVLTKQNALPLIPVVLLALYLTRPKLKELVGAVLVSASLFFLCYLPLTPVTDSVIPYAVNNYLSSIGGQPHQWQATVNALNFWYVLKLNYAQDSVTVIGDITARQLGVALTGIWTAVGLYVGYVKRKDLYQSLFLSAAVISLGTFVFATRMHERHGYMMIAYLTFLIPYMRTMIPYILVSGISYYNLYAVWEQFFYYRWGVASWDSLTKWLSLTTTAVAVSFPLWLDKLRVTKFFHQKRVKT